MSVAGCVTAPVKEPLSLKGQTYHIHEISYASLNSVLDVYKLGYRWDSIGKKLTLYRNGKEAVLCVGSDIALVDGQSKRLAAPVGMRRGEIIIPKEFVSTYLAPLFAKKYKVTAPEIERVTAPRYTIRKIVLDPGHGGKDPGAIGHYGLMEKKIVLDITKRIKHYLEGSSIEVILTRTDDRFISLWKRADIANAEDADFFISIHANASVSRTLSGFEVYYLSEAIDDNARAVAAAENASLKYESSSFGNRKPSSALEATLWDIAYTENRTEALGLAESVTNKVAEIAGLDKKRIKAARFYVLKGAKTPSVLIEVGYISNREEAKRLINREYRDALAQAIATGIIDYKEEFEKTEGFTR